MPIQPMSSSSVTRKQIAVYNNLTPSNWQQGKHAKKKKRKTIDHFTNQYDADDGRAIMLLAPVVVFVVVVFMVEMCCSVQLK